MRRDVGVAAPLRVEQALVPTAQAREVGIHGPRLVRGPREVFAEAAAADEAVAVVVGDGLGRHAARGADGGDEGAGFGEGGEELAAARGGAGGVVGEAGAGAADARVAGAVDEGDAAGAELGEGLADAAGVGGRDGVLDVAVRGADDLGGIGVGEHVVQPGEEGLVGVGWGEEVGVEGREGRRPGAVGD